MSQPSIPEDQEYAEDSAMQRNHMLNFPQETIHEEAENEADKDTLITAYSYQYVQTRAQTHIHMHALMGSLSSL